MEKYEFFRPMSNGDFSRRVEDVYVCLTEYLATELSEGRHLQYAKVFLSDIQNQEPVFKSSDLYKKVLSAKPLTIIEQPPADGSKITVLVKTSSSLADFVFSPMRLSANEARGLDSYAQTKLMFERYVHSMEAHGLDMRTHLLRTWIYVRDIDVNYAGVVKARNDVFAEHGLTADTHFIASTGIEGCSYATDAAVAIDFLSYPRADEHDVKFLQAHGFMNPTAEYGVAFERGTRLTHGDADTFFVSGTASIDDKGNVLHIGDVLRQTTRLLKNISVLLADGGACMNDMRYFIVYLRDTADYAAVDTMLSQLWPSVPHIIVKAKVCRPSWLIEIEGIATRRTAQSAVSDSAEVLST